MSASEAHEALKKLVNYAMYMEDSIPSSWWQDWEQYHAESGDDLNMMFPVGCIAEYHRIILDALGGEQPSDE